jgi:hypothetical protein
MRTATLPDGSAQLISDAVVEFINPREIQRLFGITAHRARMLALEGKIRAVHVKRPGAASGLRLYEAASVRAFLRKNFEKPQKRPKKSLTPQQPEDAL